MAPRVFQPRAIWDKMETDVDHRGGAVRALQATPHLPLSELDILPAERALDSAPPPGSPDQDEAHYVAPLTPAESVLTEIWAAVFGVPRVVVRDSFFKLGGQSLLAVIVPAQIGARMGLSVPIDTLFTALTVAALAAFIDAGLT